MGNRHVSIYCLWESNKVFVVVSMWRSLNYEIMIGTFFLDHCDYSLLLVFTTASHAFKMHLQYTFSPLIKNLLGGAKGKYLK